MTVTMTMREKQNTKAVLQFCIVYEYLDNPDSSNPLASGFVASSCTVESLYICDYYIQ